MENLPHKTWINALPVVAGVLAILVISVLTTQFALQVTLLGLLLIFSCIAGSIPRLLILAASFVPLLGFIRRVSAGPAARVDFDPLILFPFILVAIVVLGGLRRRSVPHSQMRRILDQRVALGALLFFAAVGISIVLGGSFRPDVLYFAAALVLPILLLAIIAVGAIPDIWEAYQRILPFLGFVVGIYGVLQFAFLPEWDKSWMVSSELTSIGHPFPFAVRVFGMSESPGPYAAFLGLAIIICVDKALGSRALPQTGWFVGAGMLVIPLLLSGVRSALLSLLVCAATATIVRGRGFGRIVTVVFFVLVGVGIDRLVGVFGGNSTILTADRYTSFDPQQDNSLQARLGLIEYITNPLPHIVGNPSAPPVDNLPLDIMRAYGFLPFVLFLILAIFLTRSSFRLILRSDSSSVGLSTLYVLLLGISGNLFLSSFGILSGIIFGTALRRIMDTELGDRRRLYGRALGTGPR